jgi:hypothetical protein
VPAHSPDRELASFGPKAVSVATSVGRAVIRLVRPDPRSNTAALQLIGDGLIRALTEQIEGAAELAADCVAALAERDWPGHTELSEQLQALLGTRPAPMLRPLPVDLAELAELADILEADPTHGGGLLDLHTGQVWPQATIDYAHQSSDKIAGAPDQDDDPDRWLPVECEGSGEAYHDMQTRRSGRASATTRHTIIPRRRSRDHPRDMPHRDRFWNPTSSSGTSSVPRWASSG